MTTTPKHEVVEDRVSGSAHQLQIRAGTLLALAGAGLVAAGIAGAVMGGRARARPHRASRLAAYGAASLAASVLADSAIEHYRGSFKKPAMFVAPPAASLTLATAVATALSPRFGTSKPAIFGAAIATGLFGIGFHIKNILSHPGGLSFNNLFYRAPFGAPGALALAGAAGIGAVAAERAAQRDAAGAQRDGRAAIDRLRTGRRLGAVTAVGLFGLLAEVGLLHFRGAFHNKLMYAPIVCVPLTALALLAATADPQAGRRRVARRALQATASLGLIGSGLHAYGVSRNMGGFANWTQNLFQGPPIAAPPSLAGLALMGFSALDLLASKTKESPHG